MTSVIRFPWNPVQVGVEGVGGQWIATPVTGEPGVPQTVIEHLPGKTAHVMFEHSAPTFTFAGDVKIRGLVACGTVMENFLDPALQATEPVALTADNQISGVLQVKMNAGGWKLPTPACQA